MSSDVLERTRALISCPSVTPHEGGALDLLQSWLEPLGFVCHRLDFSAENTPPVNNLYARRGTGTPHFCFAGHTDVVPPGPETAWSSPPFTPTIDGNALRGRGAVDMKGAIAAFVSAVAQMLEGPAGEGSVSLLITGDEEGPAINGTVKMLEWLESRGEQIDHCLVGEPTNPEALGDMIKIGRRGSVNVDLTINGTQGHVAYPHRASNPIPVLAKVVAHLSAQTLDEGTPHFQPSNLEFTTIDVGNPTTNVIPGAAHARLNIRFNDLHTGQGLIEWLYREIKPITDDYVLNPVISGEAFLTPPGPFPDLVARAVAAETGRTPEFSTSGGTSDARFIQAHCPVVEFGLVGATMHKVDERVRLDDLTRLTAIYRRVLTDYFAANVSG